MVVDKDRSELAQRVLPVWGRLCTTRTRRDLARSIGDSHAQAPQVEILVILPYKNILICIQ